MEPVPQHGCGRRQRVRLGPVHCGQCLCGQRDEDDAAVELYELAEHVLRYRIDQGAGTQQDESDLPLLSSNLAYAYSDAHHTAEHLATWSEAVSQQRQVHGAGFDQDSDWVLAIMLNGFAGAAIELGFESEAKSSLQEAEDLLAHVFERRPVAAKVVLDQINPARSKLLAK